MNDKIDAVLRNVEEETYIAYLNIMDVAFDAAIMLSREIPKGTRVVRKDSHFMFYYSIESSFMPKLYVSSDSTIGVRYKVEVSYIDWNSCKKMKTMYYHELNFGESK